MFQHGTEVLTLSRALVSTRAIKAPFVELSEMAAVRAVSPRLFVSVSGSIISSSVGGLSSERTRSRLKMDQSQTRD